MRPPARALRNTHMRPVCRFGLDQTRGRVSCMNEPLRRYHVTVAAVLYCFPVITARGEPAQRSRPDHDCDEDQQARVHGEHGPLSDLGLR